MSKRIAVVTGASSGIGKAFALSLCEHVKIDELWAVARDETKLNALKPLVPFEVKTVSLDLSETESLEKYKALLEQEKPEIAVLINCSGYGKFESTLNIPLNDNLGMIDLNCRGLVGMTQLSVPYMKAGSRIIEIASMAALQPTPYINVYAASKAFVLSFTRALGAELKKSGIKVLAVCPFWTKTSFFSRAVGKGDTIVKKYVAMYEPEQIVNRAWKDIDLGRDKSIYGFKAKMQAFLVSVFPAKFVMNVWLNQQKLK